MSSEIPIAADETIIDAAIRAGRDLPDACRGGMCCTCRTRLVQGQVAMDVNYSLEPGEFAAGFVLTCQGDRCPGGWWWTVTRSDACYTR